MTYFSVGATKKYLTGFFDELEKISQAPGSLAHRASLGAQGAWGGLQGGAGGSASAAPPPTSGVGAPIGPGDSGGAGADMPGPASAGDMGGGAALGMPSGGPPGGAGGGAALGIPGGGPPGGVGGGAALGIPSGGNPMDSSAATPSPGGTSAGSLLSPQRRRGPGTGSLSSAESAEIAPPSAAEFGG